MLLDLCRGGKACGALVCQVSDFGVVALFPDDLCFPPVGWQPAGGLATAELADGGHL